MGNNSVLEFVMSSQTLPAQAKQLFHYLFEQASLGIAVEDLEGRLLLANPALCSMLGYREDELCDMSCSQFDDPQNSQEEGVLFQQLRDGVIDKYSLEKRYVRKQGGQLWGRLNVSLCRNEDGESPLVFAFVEDITERKRSEEALRVSEERFRLAAQAAKMYAYEWEVQTDTVVRSEEYVNVLGYSYQQKELTRQQILAAIHPDDHALFIGSVDQLTPQNSTSQLSYRVIRPDGSVVWLEKSARGFFDEQGTLQRMIGMVANITERKLAEAALASVSRRLIDAQEQERSRIARELHDDIGQRLAILSVNLARIQRNPPNSSELAGRIGEVQKLTLEIAADIQSLSHELHSSRLQYLGLVPAVTGFCREFGEQQKVEIDVKIRDLPVPLPPDISLCFFRVLQEALHNSAKHSGVQSFEVELWETPDEIHLAVRDSGVGFDPDAIKARQGLGLISMEERLKLLNGTLSIESQLQRGTTIHARIPFSARKDSLRPVE
jgi:PAS domain S-box-containing protein